MQNKISFVKYTSNGNNFVIVDETDKIILSESDKKKFAQKAIDINFGIGCDNFLVLQKFSIEALESINKVRNYWKNIPKPNKAKFIFRMLEPDGNEALSCGNGLLCIADYIFKKYKIDKTDILSEIPCAHPKLITLGTDNNMGKSYVNMGVPRKFPSHLINRSIIVEKNTKIEEINNLKIIFRSNDLNYISNLNNININGYLAFTGEPHLVLFVDNSFSVKRIKDFLFIDNTKAENCKKIYERRANFGKWLVYHIGYFLNMKSIDKFPLGVNVNFARIIDRKLGIIEYRTYERGINHETLSCGTGAVAVAHIAKTLNLVDTNEITLFPYLCRLYENNAKVILKKNKNNWILFGNPSLLYEGKYFAP
jgi:diaminopimelate epimerase